MHTIEILIGLIIINISIILTFTLVHIGIYHWTGFNVMDIRDELDSLKTANVTEIPLNHLRKIINFLGATEIPSTGGQV